jgi:O-antigen/teichoic acid export membrane protein
MDDRSRPGLLMRFRRGRLVHNAIALMISSGGTAVLGIVFWSIAAHVSDAAVVGRTSAEIAAMVLLANVAQLSFGAVFERFLPIAGAQTRAFVVRAYALCASLALAAALVYVTSGLADRFLPSTLAWRTFFVAAVVLWTIFVLQDSVLTGLRAAKWVPLENIFFAVAKLALLPAFLAASAAQGIFLAWTAPVAVTIIAVSWYLFGRRIPDHQVYSAPGEVLPAMRQILVLAFANYSTFLLSVFTPSIVTLIVIQRLGAVASAHYYLPALIASSLTYFLWNIEASFLVEASSEPGALRRHVKTTMLTGTAVLGPLITIGVVFAPLLLRIFGPTYATHGTTLLRMLLLALPGNAVAILYTAFAWLDRRLWWLVVRQLVSVVLYFAIVLALIGRLGLVAIGVASLSSSVVQGAFFLPIVIRRYRRLTMGAELAL